LKNLNRENIAGVWSAVPTPFTDKMELDTEGISRLVEHQVRLGIKGVFLASPNGEGRLMSDAMRMELAKEVVENNHDRMLLSMQIEDNPAKVMLDNIKRIEDCGIDIAVISFPFTPIEIEQEYLKELYFSVIEKSSLPIALYHINRTSPTPLFGKIILQPEVVLVKDCSNDLNKTAMILNTAKGRQNELFTLSGNEANCVSSVRRGYDGLLLNSACFTGFIAKAIFEFAYACKLEEAQALQDYMNSLLVDVFGLELDCWLTGQKQILVELGIFNTARTLLGEQISNERIARIKEIVKEEEEFLLP